MPTPIPLSKDGAPAVEAPQPGSLPRVPQKAALADEIEAAIAAEKAALEKGIEDAGLRSPAMRTGLKRLDKGQAKTAAPAAEDQEADSAGPKPSADGLRKQPAPIPSQSSLSAGYAKLARKERAAERRQAELDQREQAIRAEFERLKAERDGVEKTRQAWMTEQQAKMEELKLLDSDEIAWLERYAARKGTTPQAVYDKLMRRVLNDGVVPADDRLEAVQKELAELRAKTEADKKEREEREAQAKAEWEKRQAEQAFAQRVAQEKQSIVQYVTKEAAEQYPLLAQEDPEEIAEIAYQLGRDYFERTQKGATFDMVATHLEKQLRDAKILEEHRKAQEEPSEAADPEEEAEEIEPEPKPKETSARGTGAVKKSAKPEAARPMPKTSNGLKQKGAAQSGPKTLTHSLASQRSGAPAPRPRDDNERLERALAAWSSR